MSNPEGDRKTVNSGMCQRHIVSYSGRIKLYSGLNYTVGVKNAKFTGCNSNNYKLLTFLNSRVMVVGGKVFPAREDFKVPPILRDILEV